MDLTTTYMGMSLKNPIVPSASPLSKSLDNIRSMEDNGAAAVVMHSLFEEHITHESRELDHYLEFGSECFGESLSYLPELPSYKLGPDEYLALISRARDVVEIPIIGSLNGITTGGWLEYAAAIEEAGARALELNTYLLPTNAKLTADDVEKMYLEIVSEVKKTIRIPLAVKLSPFFSAPANMAKRLHVAGADALVLFNRFYQSDFDLQTLEVVPRLTLSNSDELRLRLNWVAIIYGKVPVDLAITGGVHTHEDVLKGLMAGARVTMMASELLQNGMGRIRQILEALRAWMEEYEYESVLQMQGSMCQNHVGDPSVFERANYIKMLQSWRPDSLGKSV